MKALFLQTKICEVSQIRINKNPPCLVVNKHLLKVETSNQTWWRKQFGVLFPFSISNFRCGIQWFHWKQTTSFARHIISCNAVAFPNQVVGGRESLLNKGKFLSPTPLLTPTQKLGNHRVLWHLASNHFVSTFDNDGIMAHPTHQA